MQKKNEILKLWPTFVGQFYNLEHVQIKKELLAFFEDYRKKNPTRDAGENINLYESSYDLHTSKNKEIEKVIRFMQLSVFDIYKEANEDFLKKRGKGKNYTVIVKNSWFIIYDDGGFVAPHNHGDCSWSCVYYVQIGKNANNKNGATFLQTPNLSKLHDGIGSESFGFKILRVKPEEGKLVIWPSHIVHGSLPYVGNEKRIIISANFIINSKE